MKILALDLATKTGWAHSCGISGTWLFKVQPNESSGMRLIRLRGKLDEIWNNVGIDLIVTEAVHVRFVKAASVLFEMRGLIKLWCVDRGVEYDCNAKPSQIKLHATGKGNADKDQMIESASAKWPETIFIDDNQADAKWLLDLTQSQLAITQ